MTLDQTTNMRKIGIIDYGSGNIFSLHKAFQNLEFKTEVSSNPTRISDFSHLVIPGVGAFSSAMELLCTRGFIDPIHDAIKRGTPILAICVGMQILFDSSEEFGHHRGLGLISGNVLRISETDHYGNILPVPHIGWSATFCNKNRVSQRKYDLFRGLESTQKFYYLHSYAANVVDEDAIIAQTLYGGFPIIAAVQRVYVFGTQFHQEKSASAGLHVLRNFGSM